MYQDKSRRPAESARHTFSNPFLLSTRHVCCPPLSTDGECSLFPQYRCPVRKTIHELPYSRRKRSAIDVVYSPSAFYVQDQLRSPPHPFPPHTLASSADRSDTMGSAAPSRTRFSTTVLSNRSMMNRRICSRYRYDSNSAITRRYRSSEAKCDVCAALSLQSPSLVTSAWRRGQDSHFCRSLMAWLSLM